MQLKKRDFVLDGQTIGKTAFTQSYNSLQDENLIGYFNKDRRKYLRKMGIITKYGTIISQEKFNLLSQQKSYHKKSLSKLKQQMIEKLNLQNSNSTNFIEKNKFNISNLQLKQQQSSNFSNENSKNQNLNEFIQITEYSSKKQTKVENYKTEPSVSPQKNDKHKNLKTQFSTQKQKPFLQIRILPKINAKTQRKVSKEKLKKFNKKIYQNDQIQPDLLNIEPSINDQVS